MTIDLWVASAVLSATVAAGVALLAALRGGPPPGRELFSVFLALVAVDLVWISVQHSDYRFWNPGAMLILDHLAAGACVLLGPVGVALSLRFGQPTTANSRGDLWPLLLAGVAAPTLFFLGLRSGSAVSLSAEGSDVLLGLKAGPARAAAVLILVSSCFALLRLHGVARAARRSGLTRLARAAAALGAAFAGLFLVSSQLLLYGALSLRLITFGSLTTIPLLLACLPIWAPRQHERAVLPPAARPNNSMLLLLGLGLFLITLAGVGQVVHQTLPAHGLIWFRWGGAVLVVLAAFVFSFPAVRRPLSAYFDQDLASAPWDFRREWARANSTLGAASSREDLVQRLRFHLETVFGPTGTVFWWASRLEASADAYGEGEARILPLTAENPLRRRAVRTDDVLELVLPAQRLEELPLVVENHELIERHGFRVFGSAHLGESIGILGLAPPDGVRLDSDQRALIYNLTGMTAAYFKIFEARDLAAMRRDHGSVG